jgi:hypothetical protein
MSRFDPNKLNVRFIKKAKPTKPLSPRRYTLTHSDLTGDLFMVIGTDYDYKAISNIYTRLMRDEVLAEWLPDQTFHVYCHVSGGIVIGLAGWRDEILRHHMPQVLEAFRFGDRAFFKTHPELDQTTVRVHFRASQRRYHRVENWGIIGDYALFKVGREA